MLTTPVSSPKTSPRVDQQTSKREPTEIGFSAMDLFESATAAQSIPPIKPAGANSKCPNMLHIFLTELENAVLKCGFTSHKKPKYLDLSQNHFSRVCRIFKSALEEFSNQLAERKGDFLGVSQKLQPILSQLQVFLDNRAMGNQAKCETLLEEIRKVKDSINNLDILKEPAVNIATCLAVLKKFPKDLEAPDAFFRNLQDAQQEYQSHDKNYWIKVKNQFYPNSTYRGRRKKIENSTADKINRCNYDINKLEKEQLLLVNTTRGLLLSILPVLEKTRRESTEQLIHSLTQLRSSRIRNQEERIKSTRTTFLEMIGTLELN